MASISGVRETGFVHHVAGTIIDGKYQLEGVLGRGGMGSVWVARHRKLDVRVAVKLMSPALAASADARARFEREAKAAAQLKSPHVVDVRDYGIDGDTPYLVLELLEGEDLDARLQRQRRLAPAEAGWILAQVAKALGRAHEAGIVHRDLKPANLFIARTEDGEIMKILDFGIARARGSVLAGDATKTGSLLGSPHYMSPEQARGASDLDLRSDLWSLGVILFRALTGRLPFDGDQVGDVIVRVCTDPIPIASRIAPDLPPTIDHFFARALTRDRDQRFSSVRELVDAFTWAITPQAPISAPALPVGLAIGSVQPAPIASAALPASSRQATSDSLSAAGQSVARLPRVTAGSKASWAAVGLLVLAALASLVFAVRRVTAAPSSPGVIVDATRSGTPTSPGALDPAPSSAAVGTIAPTLDLGDKGKDARDAPTSPPPSSADPEGDAYPEISAEPSVTGAPALPIPSSDAAPRPDPARSAQEVATERRFAASAAREALSRASWAVGRCRFPEAPHTIPSITATVKVTFWPTGKAGSVQVNPPLGGTPIGACIVAALKSVSVPAFDGKSVSVVKSFSFQ